MGWSKKNPIIIKYDFSYMELGFEEMAVPTLNVMKEHVNQCKMYVF